MTRTVSYGVCVACKLFVRSGSFVSEFPNHESWLDCGNNVARSATSCQPRVYMALAFHGRASARPSALCQSFLGVSTGAWCFVRSTPLAIVVVSASIGV